jgi:glycosyltransferase involved in cell wall biosynthesis
MKFIAFSQYLAYNVGGAEKSMMEILKKLSTKEHQIEIISFKNKKFNAQNSKSDFPKEWKISFINTLELKRFFYLEYVLNRSRLKEIFSKLDKDAQLYTYALYYPTAINAFDGKSTLYIRCEHDLGLNYNYHNGIKYILKEIYKLIEWPFFYLYKQDLKRALQKADKIICNSNFTKKLLYDLYQVDSKVENPYVNSNRLLEEYNSRKNEIKDKGVVFVGDAIIKGIKTVEKTAALLPNISFYIFKRDVTQTLIKGNIHYMPWQKSEADIYKYAKVVIVPSIWLEAFGRVSKEADLLGIPVLVSDRGGLPESIAYKEQFIIKNYLDEYTWAKEIEKYV